MLFSKKRRRPKICSDASGPDAKNRFLDAKNRFLDASTCWLHMPKPKKGAGNFQGFDCITLGVGGRQCFTLAPQTKCLSIPLAWKVFWKHVCIEGHSPHQHPPTHRPTPWGGRSRGVIHQEIPDWWRRRRRPTLIAKQREDHQFILYTNTWRSQVFKYNYRCPWQNRYLPSQYPEYLDCHLQAMRKPQ